MSGIIPANNTFYKRNTISTSGAINLSAHFKDLPQSGTVGWDLKGGPNANRFVVEGEIPLLPNYGGGSLSNVYLESIVQATDVSESSMLPTISSYKVQSGVTMLEGTGTQLSTQGSGGANLMILTRHVDKSLPWMEETFDGSEKSLGEVQVYGAPGGNTLLGENPYVEAEDACSRIYLGGDFSFFHIGEDVDGGSADFLRTYFGKQELVTTSTVVHVQTGQELESPKITSAIRGNMKDRKIYVKPVNRKKPRGLWTTRYDNRTGLNKFTVFKPIWKFSQLKSIIRFERNTPVSTDTTPQPVSKNNTIFTQGAQKTPSISNSWEGNPDGTGWCESWLELSTQEYEDGGQSLKMAHFWDDASDNPATNNIYGSRFTINPQFTRICTDLGPVPFALDQALATAQTGMAVVSGNNTLTAPEIDIKFKITKMGTALFVSGGTNTTQYNVPNFSTGSSPGALKSVTTDDTTALTTLLRSFTVTFSNGPPKDGESLNAFLVRTISGSYASSLISPATGNAARAQSGVVGGVTFLRYQNKAGHKKNCVAATPLLTECSFYHYPTYTGASSEYVQKNCLWIYKSGTNAASSDYEDVQLPALPYNLDISKTGYNGTRSPTDGGTTTSTNEPSVQLSMDEWINMKVVWHPALMTSASQATGTASAIDIRSTGNPAARVYFTQGAYQDTGVGTTSTSGAVNTGDEKPPSFNLTFPCQQFPGNTGGGAVTKQSLGGLADTDASPFDLDFDALETAWPRYMTLWLQNYRYVKPGDSANLVWGKNNSNDSILTGEPLKVDSISPITISVVSGSRESEVFVDSIAYRGFNGEIANVSAGASSFTKPLAIKDVSQKRYFSKGNNENSSDSLWANEFPSSQGKRVETAYGPTYVCIGYEDGTGSTFTGGTATNKENVMLWNGFSYAGAFSELAINDYRTTNAWFSTVSGAQDASNAAYSDTTNIPAQTFRSLVNDTAAASDAGKRPATFASELNINSQESSITRPGGFAFASGTHGTGTFSTDGWTQKGTVMFRAMSGSADGTQASTGGMFRDSGSGVVSNWAKTVNFACSARVMGVPSFDEDSPYFDYNGYAAIVDNPEIFDEDPVGTNTYKFFTGLGHGRPATTFNHDYGVMSDAMMTGTAAYASLETAQSNIPAISQDLKQRRKRDGDIVFFDTKVDAFVNNTLMPWMFVSPKKYWLTLEMWPGQRTDADSTLDPYQTSGKGDIWSYGGSSDTKTYDNVCLLNSNIADFTWETGSTFNEFRYSYNSADAATTGKPALYQNTWMLDVGAPTETDLELTTDFGFGTFSEENQIGGEADIKTAYVDRPLIMDFTAAVGEVSPREPFLSTLQLNKPTANQGITTYGNDYTRTVTDGDDATADDRRPRYIFGYKDPVPEVEKLTVNPSINVVGGDINLYELTTENLNSVLFEWEESADDVWYRLLMVDNTPIVNKYTNALCWIPFNDLPGSSAGYDPQYGLVDGKGASTIKLFAPSVSGTVDSSSTLADPYGLASDSYARQRIEGLAGYAYYMPNTTGSDGTKLNFFPIAHATNGLMNDSQSEYTMMIHAKPENNGALFYKGDTSTGLNVKLVSGKVVVSGQAVTMTGTSVNPLDGQTPLAVMITYKSGSQMPMTLHVNGQLEDYVSSGSAIANFSSTAVAYIGSADGSATTQFKGYLEEFIVWKKRLYSPEVPGYFELNTKELTEYNSGNAGTAGASLTYPHHAKVFVMDYCNIRGTATGEVASSSDVGWRTTIS